MLHSSCGVRKLFSSSKLGFKKRNGAECTVPHFPAPFYSRLTFLEKATSKRITNLLEEISCINYLKNLSFMLRNKFFPACWSKEEFELCALCNVHVVLACWFFRVRYPRTINSIITVRFVHIFSILQCGMHTRTHNICSERSRLTVLFFSWAMSGALTPPALSPPPTSKTCREEITHKKVMQAFFDYFLYKYSSRTLPSYECIKKKSE
jgi:hypothetical protein